MQKKIWITSLSREKGSIQGLLGLAKKYGLAPDGHFWIDDIKKMAWQAPQENLISKETSLWVISCCPKDLESESVRYGLSLLCLRLQNIKGINFPVFFAATDEGLTSDILPTPFKGAEIIGINDKSLGAKLTARANTPVKKIPTEYRIDIHANTAYGIWFEIGPGMGETWNGVLAGGMKSEINAHGVGPAGSLPLKTVLEYQMQGIKLQFGANEFSAWAVKNKIDENHSYYVRFEDTPGAILFGQMPDDEDEAIFHHLKLC